VNPLCGDEVTVEISFDGDVVNGIAVEGQGCSISQSSASMMSEAVKGKTRHEIDELTAQFRAMMSLDGQVDLDLDPDRPGAVLGDLEALQGVRQYPVRIKCASLGWNVLLDALNRPGDS
jgi:nitrogen fixation protein NifU and related proteins